MSGSNRGGNDQALDWAFPLIGIVLAICIAIGLGWLSGLESERRYQSPHHHAEYAEANAKRACAGVEPSAMFECIYKRVEASEETARTEQDLSAQQRAASAALAAAIVSFITLIVSGIGVWFVKRTLDATLEAVEDTGKATLAMEEANRIARFAQMQQRSEAMKSAARQLQQERRQLRAYVTVDFPSINGHPCEGFVLEYNITATNDGVTPAKSLQWASKLIVAFDDEIEAESVLQWGAIAESSAILGAGKGVNTAGKLPAPITAEYQRRMEENTAGIWVVGEIRYQDIFEVRHVTRYRARYDFIRGFVWDAEGNTAT
jgi:hypothetical protein